MDFQSGSQLTLATAQYGFGRSWQDERPVTNAARVLQVWEFATPRCQDLS